MKVINLIAENFKRITAIDITPDTALVTISGKNSHGKSSTLDSLWTAILGARVAPAEPIRHGADSCRIRVDLGELIVTRTFARKEDGGYTTKLQVESTEGARFREPQRVLDELVGKLAFDPLEFARMKPRDQFDALRTFAPGVDFDAIDAANKADFARRTEVNRLAKQVRDAAVLIQIPDGLDEADQPDVSELQAQLASAADHNSQIAARKAKRQDVARTVERLRDDGNRKAEEAQELRASADALEAESQTLLEQAGAEQKRLLAAPALPEPIDTAALLEQIQALQGLAKQIEQLAEKRRREHQADELEATSAQLTAAMEQRSADKATAIAAAKLPVPGLTFGDGIVLLDGVPFDQGSDAQRLMASTAIAMAMNPKLRVLRIRDGSLLDTDSLALLEKLCAEREFQCWIERVDSSGTVGFVIEDGTLAKINGGPVTNEPPPALRPPKPAALTPKPRSAANVPAIGDDDL